MTSKNALDLATELGESFALPPCGIPLKELAKLDIDGKRLHPRHLIDRSDDDLLSIISTGYVACGMHSGDPIVIGQTVRLLASRGIAVGAHPSYPDIFGFGQEPIDLPDYQLEDVIFAQLCVVDGFARQAGSRLSTVKFHGALSFEVSYDERTAQVVARTIYKLDPTISLVCMAGSPGVRVAHECGIPVVQEAYIDRAYDRTGRIVSRKQSGALITDPTQAATQLFTIYQDGYVNSVEGEQIGMRADSFCLHSDTPNSAEILAAVMDVVRKNGIDIRAPQPRL